MNELINLISQFSKKKVLVIGDLLLDKFIEGEVSRISPEAPIPIVKVEKEYSKLGGAGNVAANVASLGGITTLAAFVGKGEESATLKRLLNKAGVKHILDDRYETIQKIRVVSRKQYLLRLDKERASEKDFSPQLKKDILAKAKEADSIVISDYAKGTVTKNLITLLEPFKSKIIVDAKPANRDLYKGLYMVKMNEKEALEMSKTKHVKEAGEKLRSTLNSNILITLGEKGIALFKHKEQAYKIIQTTAREVYDVTGAGDTVLATLALALSAKSTIENAAILSNYAAGITVEKAGTYAIDDLELKAALVSQEDSKIVNAKQLVKLVVDLRNKGKKIVWTNGCFDIIHKGHLSYLKEAKKQGDILIVGVNSDSSVRALKGPTRPINTQQERAEVLASLHMVDYVVIFDQTSPLEFLKSLKPDVFVKGGDYTIKSLNQDEVLAVKSYGGRIHLAAKVPDRSTTSIVQKMQSTSKA